MTPPPPSSSLFQLSGPPLRRSRNIGCDIFSFVWGLIWSHRTCRVRQYAMMIVLYQHLDQSYVGVVSYYLIPSPPHLNHTIPIHTLWSIQLKCHDLGSTFLYHDSFSYRNACQPFLPLNSLLPGYQVIIFSFILSFIAQRTIQEMFCFSFQYQIQ